MARRVSLLLQVWWQSIMEMIPFYSSDSDDKACFFAAASMVAEQLRQKQEIDIFKAFIDMRRVQPEHRTTVVSLSNT